MPKSSFASVEDYLAQLPQVSRRVLERVRHAIRMAVPDGEEVISYQIPAIKVGGKAVLYFAAWKEHFSLYPATAGVLAAFRKELAGRDVSKGTIRFPLSEPVPVKLITAIARLRAQEAVEQRTEPPLAQSSDRRPRPAGRRERPSSGKLTRPLHPMPEDVRAALVRRGLVAAYEARPAYQRNDYLGWIDRAKRDNTKARRLDQMLDELERGDVYMNMAWRK